MTLEAASNMMHSLLSKIQLYNFLHVSRDILLYEMIAISFCLMSWLKHRNKHSLYFHSQLGNNA